jgi:uncharacterized damage-inducible protein DinB
MEWKQQQQFEPPRTLATPLSALQPTTNNITRSSSSSSTEQQEQATLRMWSSLPQIMCHVLTHMSHHTAHVTLSQRHHLLVPGGSSLQQLCDNFNMPILCCCH